MKFWSAVSLAAIILSGLSGCQNAAGTSISRSVVQAAFVGTWTLTSTTTGTATVPSSASLSRTLVVAANQWTETDVTNGVTTKSSGVWSGSGTSYLVTTTASSGSLTAPYTATVSSDGKTFTAPSGSSTLLFTKS
jgi:hypothetical protein